MNLNFNPARRFDIPQSLSISNAGLDAPLHVILRFKPQNLGWEQCVYAIETDLRKTYQRDSCTTGGIAGVNLTAVQVEAVMPAGESALHVSLREPPPCAASPRSYNGKTVGEGGRFFPKGNPESQHWVAVLDEALVPEQHVQEVAVSLGNQYGLKNVVPLYGPYGFGFDGSYGSAKALSFHGLIRFVESSVDYFGLGWAPTVLPLPGNWDSWALERMDQRESIDEIRGLVGGTSEANDSRYRYPETVKPEGPSRPRLFVLDTRAFTTHQAFAGFTVTPVGVPGAQPQCPLGGGLNTGSDHGTASLSMALGTVGIARARPREIVQVEGLGSGNGTCSAARQDQFVAALREVAVKAEAGDVLSISAGSTGFGMVVESSIRALVERGVIVLAATGNARETVLYPPASVDEAFAIGGIQDTGLDDKWLALAPDGGGIGSAGLPADVDFHGPAAFVPTATDTSTSAIRNNFGTSLATPLMAGIAFYQLLTANLAGVAGVDLSSRVDELLRETATVRTSSQFVIPFTPTRPVFGAELTIPQQLLAVAAANDGQAVWVAGSATSSASLIRVPIGTVSDPTEPNPVATQVVLTGGTGAQCRAIAATLAGATAGCWSLAAGGRILLYDGAAVPIQEIASLAVDGVPIAVAADIEDSQARDANPGVRVALFQPVDQVLPNGNPITSDLMRLAVARQRIDQTWAVGVVELASPGPGYSSYSAVAVNCPGGSAGSFGIECDAFALLTKANGATIELWKLSFDSRPEFQAALPAPSLVTERTELGPFSTCGVPGWASGEGLAAVGLAVDDATTSNGSALSRWSFVYNRLGAGYFGTQCGFDSAPRVVNSPSPMLDLIGRRGEAWSSLSRGAFSRTGLTVSDVWNPANAQFQRELRSTIRTLHPRGAASIGANVRFIEHAIYGDDAMALSSTDGVTWSIARVRP